MCPCVRPVRSMLVLDDDEDLLTQYAKELHPRAVYATTNAAIAIELARQHQPDLALVDLRLENQPTHAALGLPKQRRPVCGTDIVPLLRAAHQEMRIVMISGGRAWTYSREAKKAGADGMLCKAYGPAKLIAIIEGDLLQEHDRPAAEPMSLQRNEHEYIAEVFVATGRNVARTAEILDIERSTLKRKLRENIATGVSDSDRDP